MIGTGANDPQKMDPKASRETLDHSIMYIFAVALEDGGWHHEKSYAPERAGRPETIELWHKIRRVEDPEWTRRYHSHDPKQKAFGGRVVVILQGRLDRQRRDRGGQRASARRQALRAAGLHPQIPDAGGRRHRAAEQDRFIAAVEQLPSLRPASLSELTFAVDPSRLGAAAAARHFRLAARYARPQRDARQDLGRKR